MLTYVRLALLLCLAFQLAKKRYAAAAEQGTERLVSASDDFTMFLWNPTVTMMIEEKQHTQARTATSC